MVPRRRAVAAEGAGGMRFIPVDAGLLKKITLDTPVALLPVSVRVHNCLKNEGLATVRDIAALPDSFFLRIPNMGPKSLGQLSRLLHDAGIATQLRYPADLRYYVPAFYQRKIDRNLSIWWARRQGESVASLARRFELSKNSIYIILHRGERQVAQLAKLEAGTSP
jgi:hypothetical protein